MFAATVATTLVARHAVAVPDHAFASQIPIGLGPVDDSIVARPLPERDVPAGELLIGRLHGRTLPVASARFVTCVADALDRIVAAT